MGKLSTVERARSWLGKRLSKVSLSQAVGTYLVGQVITMIAAWFSASWASAELSRTETVWFFVAVYLALALATVPLALAWRWIFPVPQGPGSTSAEQLATAPKQLEQEIAPPRPRQLSPYEAEHKVRTIDAILTVIRDRIKPSIFDGRKLIDLAPNAFKNPDRFPTYMQDLEAYRDIARQSANEMEALRDGSREYVDIIAATERNHDTTLPSAAESFREAFCLASTHLLDENARKVFQPLIGYPQVTFSEALRYKQLWTINAETSLVEMRRVLSQ